MVRHTTHPSSSAINIIIIEMNWNQSLWRLCRPRRLIDWDQLGPQYDPRVTIDQLIIIATTSSIISTVTIIYMRGSSLGYPRQLLRTFLGCLACPPSPPSSCLGSTVGFDLEHCDRFSSRCFIVAFIYYPQTQCIVIEQISALAIELTWIWVPFNVAARKDFWNFNNGGREVIFNT